MKESMATENDLKAQLFVLDEKAYGENYKKHLLEQYKLCVEMADKISSRRCTANNFFLSVNTLLLTAIGILSRFGSSLAALDQWWLVITSIAGVLFCWAWLVTIRCHRDLNTAKFEIINAIEQKLPTMAFNREWVLLNPENNATRYPQLTKVESWVPLIFIFLYLVLIVLGVASSTHQLLTSLES